MTLRRDGSDEFERAGGLGAHIPREALRDGASAEAVERIWSRLDATWEPAALGTGRKPAWTWALAASALTFVVGLSVGQRLAVPKNQPGTLAVRAEPSLDAPLQGREPERPNAEQSHDAHEPPRELSQRLARSHVRRGPAPVGSVLEDAAFVGEPALAEGLNGVPAPEAAPEAAEPKPPPSWQRMANAGEYEAALFELGQDGGFESALLASDAEQLMLLADVARATGQTQRALAALRRIVSEFRAEPVAPLAAYSLGNLLEKSGDARGAAQAFAVYRTLSPEGDFAEDALVRQLRSAVERGDRDHAEQLAAQYHASFPDGVRAAEIKRWLALLDAESQAEADAEDETSAESDEGPESPAESSPGPSTPGASAPAGPPPAAPPAGESNEAGGRGEPSAPAAPPSP